MPPLEEASLEQTAVLWPAAGALDVYGYEVLGDPVEVPVRWDDATTEPQDAQSTREGTSVSATVDRDVPVGSLMWLGTLAGLPGTGSSAADVATFRVTEFNEVPDIKGREVHRSVKLMRE